MLLNLPENKTPSVYFKKKIPVLTDLKKKNKKHPKKLQLVITDMLHMCEQHTLFFWMYVCFHTLSLCVWCVQADREVQRAVSGRCSGLHWPGSNYRSWGRTCSWAQQVPASGEPVKPQAHSLPDSFSFTRGDSTLSLQKRKRKSGIMERSKEHQNFSNNFCQNNLFPFFKQRPQCYSSHFYLYSSHRAMLEHRTCLKGEIFKYKTYRRACVCLSSQRCG